MKEQVPDWKIDRARRDAYPVVEFCFHDGTWMGEQAARPHRQGLARQCSECHLEWHQATVYGCLNTDCVGPGLAHLHLNARPGMLYEHRLADDGKVEYARGPYSCSRCYEQGRFTWRRRGDLGPVDPELRLESEPPRVHVITIPAIHVDPVRPFPAADERSACWLCEENLPRYS